MPSLLKTSIPCQQIFNSSNKIRGDFGVSYSIAGIGNIWLSHKDVAAIKEAGPDAICDLVASETQRPQERIWAMTNIRTPDATDLIRGYSLSSGLSSSDSKLPASPTKTTK